MSYELVLFVGGSHDGEWMRVSAEAHDWVVTKRPLPASIEFSYNPDPVVSKIETETYIRRQIAGDTRVRPFFLLHNLTLDDMIDALVDGYRKPKV